MESSSYQSFGHGPRPASQGDSLDTSPLGLLADSAELTKSQDLHATSEPPRVTQELARANAESRALNKLKEWILR